MISYKPPKPNSVYKVGSEYFRFYKLVYSPLGTDMLVFITNQGLYKEAELNLNFFLNAKKVSKAEAVLYGPPLRPNYNHPSIGVNDLRYAASEKVYKGTRERVAAFKLLTKALVVVAVFAVIGVIII